MGQTPVYREAIDPLSGSTRTFSYDALNRLTSTQLGSQGATQYRYNAEHQRVRKSGYGGQVDFVYSGANLLSESDVNTTSMRRHYVWMGTTPIALIDNGNIYPIHPDQVRERGQGARTGSCENGVRSCNPTCLR